MPSPGAPEERRVPSAHPPPIQALTSGTGLSLTKNCQERGLPLSLEQKGLVSPWGAGGFTLRIPVSLGFLCFAVPLLFAFFSPELTREGETDVNF